MNILVLTYWSLNEPLTRSAVLPYLDMITDANTRSETRFVLFTLEKERYALDQQETTQLKLRFSQQNVLWMPRPYFRFGFQAGFSWFKSLLLLRRVIREKNIDVIHAFGSPAGMAAHILHRWLKLPYVVDSYEPHARSMVENGSWRKKSPVFYLLKYFESKQAQHAKMVIATSEGMRQYCAEEYGHVPKSFTVKPACIDLDRFQIEGARPELKEALNIHEEVVGVYAGKLGGIYLKQETFDLFKACYDIWEGNFIALLLTDASMEEVTPLAQKAGLPLSALRMRFVDHDKVQHYLHLAHFAMNMVNPIPSKRFCTSIKDGEYWACGLPVIIPKDISDDSQIIAENGVGVVLEGFEREQLEFGAKEMKSLLAREGREKLAEKLRQIVHKYRSYDIARAAYSEVYEASSSLLKPLKHFLVLIYNSYRDPLYQNLIHSFLLRQAALNPDYRFELLTFEQKRYALSKSEKQREIAQLSGKGIHWHPLAYHSGSWMFFVKSYDLLSAFIQTLRLHRQHQLKAVISFANAAAAIGVIVSKLIQSKLVVYSFEPHHEFLAEFGIWRRKGWRYRLLKKAEQLTLKKASHIITGTKYLAEKIKPLTKAQVYRAPSAVDPKAFQFNAAAREKWRNLWGIENQHVLIYVGKFDGIYYGKEIPQFCANLATRAPFFFVFITQQDHNEVRGLLKKYGLKNEQYYLGSANSRSAIAGLNSAADIGLTAIPPYPSQRYRSPVKVGEYLMSGLPYITCEGVSEDDDVAVQSDVGIVLKDLETPMSDKKLIALLDLLSQDKTTMRDRCRKAGIDYRSRSIADGIFDEILRDV